MKIRKVVEADVNKIVKLRRDSFENIAKRMDSIEVYKTLVSKNTSENILRKIREREMFCLFDGDEIFGTVCLSEDEISGVYVRFDKVKQGLGKELMRFIEEHAKTKGIGKVWLDSAEKAKDFYSKLGYVVVEEIEKNNGINYLMEKKL
jgi:predicted N-acetyltransferase YhbS